MLGALFGGGDGSNGSNSDIQNAHPPPSPPLPSVNPPISRQAPFRRSRGRGGSSGSRGGRGGNWRGRGGRGRNFGFDQRGQGFHSAKLPDYADDKERIKDFLIGFTNEVEPFKYIRMMQLVANREIKVFKLSLDDMEKFFRGTEHKGLVRRIEGNTLHYKAIIESAIQASLPDPSLASAEHFEEDVIDVLLKHRAERDAAAHQAPRNQNPLVGQNDVTGNGGGAGDGVSDELDEEEEHPAYLEEFSKRL